MGVLAPTAPAPRFLGPQRRCGGGPKNSGGAHHPQQLLEALQIVTRLQPVEGIVKNEEKSATQSAATDSPCTTTVELRTNVEPGGVAPPQVAGVSPAERYAPPQVAGASPAVAPPQVAGACRMQCVRRETLSPVSRLGPGFGGPLGVVLHLCLWVLGFDAVNYYCEGSTLGVEEILATWKSGPLKKPGPQSYDQFRALVRFFHCVV